MGEALAPILWTRETLVSLLTPNDAYFKSRRFLVVVSGVLLLCVFVGILPDSSDASLTLWSMKLQSADSLPRVVFVILLYGAWQYWSSWFIQTEEVRKFFINRVDVLLTLGIALLSAIVFVWPFVQKYFSFDSQFLSNVAAAIGGLLLGAGFLYTNTVLRRRFKREQKHEAADMASRLIGQQWTLHFNPSAQSGKKAISFAPDGTIAIGRNDNENRWRVEEGTLELLNAAGQVFSRFRYDPSKNMFTHTNDPDTLSIRDQTILPA